MVIRIKVSKDFDDWLRGVKQRTGNELSNPVITKILAANLTRNQTDFEIDKRRRRRRVRVVRVRNGGGFDPFF